MFCSVLSTGLKRSDFEPDSHPDVFEGLQREILRKQNDTERKLDEMQQCMSVSGFLLKSSFVLGCRPLIASCIETWEPSQRPPTACLGVRSYRLILDSNTLTGSPLYQKEQLYLKYVGCIHYISIYPCRPMHLPGRAWRCNAWMRLLARAEVKFNSLSSVVVIFTVNGNADKQNKKLSYCWETVRRESMPRIAEMDVEMTT